ncbi:hypothetical protein OIE68_06890 [Nocardia vinacea]|uniref:hypothetical protein n=1 Tax=Nocardia vinacea TaxID=96468 RepID=UPI002E1248CE|nr:hypothetical protein OIE68_06890 [Nocardia vinacea]
MNELDPDLSNPVTRPPNSLKAGRGPRDRRRAGSVSGWRAAVERGLAALLLGQITLDPTRYR